MILLQAMRSNIGAKLRISQIGFVPIEKSTQWTKIDGYEYITRERRLHVSLRQGVAIDIGYAAQFNKITGINVTGHNVTYLSDKDVFGCTVSDCRPGYFVTTITDSGMAKRLGIEGRVIFLFSLIIRN